MYYGYSSFILKQHNATELLKSVWFYINSNVSLNCLNNCIPHLHIFIFRIIYKYTTDVVAGTMCAQIPLTFPIL